MRTIDILAYGDPALDMVMAVDEPPGRDDKVLGQRLGSFPGGATTNAACVASRLGAKSAVFGRVGRDAEGRLLASDVERFGVSGEFLSVDASHPSGLATVMVAKSGEKSLVFAPMPPPVLDETRLSDALHRTHLLYTLPRTFAEFDALSRIAHAAGALVAIDIEPSVLSASDHISDYLRRANVVFFNERGFMKAMGVSPSIKAIKPLLGAGPDVIVVTRGSAGALAATANETAETAAFPTTVVDTTGAGDCFNGAFLVAMRERQTLNASVRFGAAAASCVVSHLGARTGAPHRKELERLLSAHA